MKKGLFFVEISILLLVVFNLQTVPTTIILDTSALNYENSFHIKQIGGDKAWKITNGSKDITIAVIDSGIDFSHPQLQNNIEWINPGEIANNSIDDDGNGYVDDVYGWDFVSDDNVPGPEVNDSVHWHATFIAGIIAAPIDGEGVAGIAPNITLMNIRVLKADNYAGTDVIEFGEAIKYAVDNGADVISMSLQYYPNSSYYYDDIVYAVNHNVVVVSITGNTWQPLGGQNVESFPGAYDEVIAVGATGYTKEKADYSNYGKWTELVAPVGDEGAGMISTFPPDTYAYGWGTSFACPQVAAAVALMKSVNNDLSVEEIRDILHRTATDLGEPGKDIYFGYGLLNVSAALNEIVNPKTTTPETTKTSLSYMPIIMAILTITAASQIIKKKKLFLK
ncbi:MAG: S8 family serine peptidase [Candidatus Heimdallarchaeaceae archaeon]